MSRTKAMRRNWFRHRVWWDEEGFEARGDAQDDPAKPRVDESKRLADYCERWLIVTRSTVACMMSGEAMLRRIGPLRQGNCRQGGRRSALGRGGRRAVDRGHHPSLRSTAARSGRLMLYCQSFQRSLRMRRLPTKRCERFRSERHDSPAHVARNGSLGPRAFKSAGSSTWHKSSIPP